MEAETACSTGEPSGSSASSPTLRWLAAAGWVHAVRKGTWSLQEHPDPQVLLEYVSAPYPAYVSLQSALYAHGMVEQVPSVLYAVTPGRTARVRTRLGTYSLYHEAPEFFDGYVQLPSGAKLATPEKALVDVFYLSFTRVRLFTALPELTLPRAFRVKAARAWVARIPSARLRAIAKARLEAALRSAQRDWCVQSRLQCA
jgi:hypothetical protein